MKNDPVQAITELREAGCDVKVRQLRRAASREIVRTWNRMDLTEHRLDSLPLHTMAEVREQDLQLFAKGGRTEVTITLPSGEICQGAADVYYKDNFNHLLGLTIALGRALKSGPVPVAEAG